MVDPANPQYDSRGGCNAIIDSETGILILGCKNTVVPDGVKAIGFAAFMYVPEISELLLPESVTVIVAYAYYSCMDMERLNIPASVKVIDHNAFGGCHNISSVSVDPDTEV